jgi:hypothetical protein
MISMRRVSMAARDELVVAIAKRYQGSLRWEKARILDEFVAVTGYHRKHAMRLLREGRAGKPSGARLRRRVYDEAVGEALTVLWEASDRICGKRLKPLLPELIAGMERHGHLQLAAEVRAALLRVSAATIDRALRRVREQAGGRPRRRAVPSAVRRSVPVRTFSDWRDPPPGFFEADLVAHSGPKASGSFVQTLVLTDIATGWTECAPLLVREQHLLVEVLTEIRAHLPFALLGFDTDNDSVFINETVQEYCRIAGVEFTRCRPYRKNDQAWVEQKNGSVVRRMVGYRRFEGLEAAAILADLYARVRLFVNFFQPSFKLAEKTRDGAQVRKRHHPPATPCQRLLADPRTATAVRDRVMALKAGLDPVRLLAEIRAAQQRLVALANPMTDGTPAPTLEVFLAGLRTAWKQGEVRPTAQPAAKAVRWWRSRPDPFETTWPLLREWFEAEPELTGRQLLERLQAEHPGIYPNGQLRTLQRRLKGWRREAARRMVFTTPTVEQGLAIDGAAGSVFGNGERQHSGGRQSPVDLPLRLDDADASPTTPQGPQQQVMPIEEKQKRKRRSASEPDRSLISVT